MEKTFRYLVSALLFLLISCNSACVSAGEQPFELQRNVWANESGCRNCNETHCPEGLCPPSAPRASVIGSHSITLTWKLLNHSAVVYIPQWTGPSLPGAWTHRENVSEPPFTVANLEPFSWYKFKIWAVILEQYTCSPESPMYRTLEAFGVPSSPPSIESVDSIDGESVEVSWSAPENPGEPIVGYNLNLTSQEDIISISTGGNVFFTTFFPTFPNTTYRVSIAAVSREGQGPAAEANVTTPARDEQNGNRWLFLSRMNSLRRKEVAAVFYNADCLPDGLIEANITGVAIHHSSQQVYFSEGSRIWVKGAVNLSDLSDLQVFHSAPLEVTALSVDWLSRRLYYVSGGKVYYCGLEDCSYPVVFNLSIPSAPLRINADPYNGWLFLLLHNGIYRSHLSEVSGQSENLTHVVKSNSVRDFVVRFPSKRLVFFHESSRTLSAVSLDGSSPVTLCSDVTAVTVVQSLAYEDSFFLLTNGQAVYYEVRQGDIVVFNENVVDCDSFHPTSGAFDNLRYFSPSSQPYPVPRRPRNLQVLFGSDKATLQWDTPALMMGASPSAWQDWTYTVKSSVNGSVDQILGDVTATQATVTGLLSWHHYTMTVWAESPGGSSASVMFNGTTLQPVDDTPYIVGANDTGLWKQDLNSFVFLKPLATNVKAVRDMDWYNGTLYWTNGSGHINWMELNDSHIGLRVITMPMATDAEAVAFDWLGQQLYWSCQSSWVCRGSKSSQEPEVVVQAKHTINSLVIDSPNAVIYWTTTYSVECSRLDGEEHLILQRLGVLSGKTVAGITIDLAGGLLYWLVQDGSILNLYTRHIPSNSFKNIPGWSSYEVFNNELVYYSGRLIWLDGNKELRIQEVDQTESVLMSPNNTLTAVTLLQSTLKLLPDGFVSPPVVIPQAVPKTSIHLEGNVTLFQILWDSSSNVEFGSVFYCVESDVLLQPTGHHNKSYPGSFCHPSNRFSETIITVRKFQSSTKFNIIITPYTYWGKGDSTFKVLHSPESGGYPNPTETDMDLVIIFTVTTGTLLIVIAIILLYWYRRRKKKEPLPSTQTSPQGPDEELEGIRGLVGLANACYAVSALPVHSETGSLPVFPRDCLRLQRLLGSGAFGEVYEGITIGNPTTEMLPDKRVAVKTLRKGATDHDKLEFLKEAHLMGQFEHPNILHLLGVCLLNEPQYLILELMEGGDLRSYLRGARSATKHSVLLNLADLVDVCLDVAKGCAYLEKMHFIHRDLAARNCLVSVRSYTDPDRIVKIGDFGLARDVYKNDYYRKRGEGLLPVRWMSPESLTDGVFNKHSDVWAFGVLLWEIVTLGKQPYPVYSNLEVLHHINSGGRLLAPTECPQRLYSLMLDCWRKEPRERPSFRRLQTSLGQFKESVAHLTQGPDVSTGHVNHGYEEDEEICSGVDEDETPVTGLTHILSEEGLNYLMYRVDAAESDSDQPDSSPHCEEPGQKGE